MKNLMKEFLSSKGSTTKLSISILCMLLYSIINARITIWISNIIGNTDNANYYMKYLNLLIIGLITNTILSYVKQVILRRAYHKSFTDINNRISDKILEADYDLFTKYSAGQIQSIVNNINLIAAGGRISVNLFQCLSDFVIATISICLIEIRLLIVIIVVYGLSLIIFRKIYAYLNKLDVDATEIRHKRDDEIHKIIQGFAEVRTNKTQQFHRNSITKMNDECRSRYIKKTDIMSFNVMVMEIVDSIITIVTVLYSIIVIPQGLMSSTAMTLVLFAWRLLNPLLGFIEISNEISEATAFYKKYRTFMDISPKITDGDIELETFDSSIQFKNVSFSYEKSDTVLDKINLSIKKGEKIGICGYSGGGKSTLMKLIPRLYDVTSGSIKIDGIDIRELTQNSLRSKIGIVHQSNYIFKGDILYNITYGIENVSIYEVIDACKKASIYDFIRKLPKGFRTDVGPNGVKLSGGQQQRIALARIFLTNPDIILLDEATSGLDNETELVIQDSLRLFKDKTIIAIAHRLSTIQDFDRIVVIDEHKVSEVGTHEGLLEQKGLYYDLYTTK